MALPSVLFERARLLYQQGRITDAISELKQLLALEPDNDAALALYGHCLLDEKKYKEAEEMISRAIALSPYHAFYFYLLSFSAYKQDQYVKAIEKLDEAIRLDPYQAEYFGLMAYILLAQKKFQEALGKADEGLELDPENLTSLNARSVALNKLKRTDDAAETMRSALAMDPDNPYSHNTIGWNLLEKGQHKTAAIHFREALRIAPDMQFAQEGLKEALKSVIPPYRWLLQFSFWLNNKGKNFRWIFFIAVYLAVRIIINITENSPDYYMMSYVVAGIYFLFIGTSWIIGPLANVFLLFHRDGKYALTVTEKWNARLFMFCIGTGLLMLILAVVIGSKAEADNGMLAGIVMLTLSIPAGHMSYPVRLKKNSIGQWLSMGMIAIALTVICLAYVNPEAADIPFFIYLMLFVLWSWLK